LVVEPKSADKAKTSNSPREGKNPPRKQTESGSFRRRK
jgi:hypothetical protein